MNDEEINDEDYAHAQKVWTEFNCGTLEDYHDVYLASDVLLLADVFESFRRMALETYKLNPAHYFTAPGLSWDAMLKLTKVKLQLIDDPDMYLMIENGLRGGVSVITKKHAVANNPMVDGYDDSRPNNYLMYLDATTCMVGLCLKVAGKTLRLDDRATTSRVGCNRSTRRLGHGLHTRG